MSNVICGRITRSFADVSGVFVSWANKSDKYWVYEHEADDKVSRTHCHFLFKGTQDTVKKVKERQDYKALGLIRHDHAYKEWDEEKGKTYISYMSKGRLDPLMTNDKDTADLAKMEGYDKKEGSKKENYYDIAMAVKDSCSMDYVINRKDAFGNSVIDNVRVIRDFTELRIKLLKALADNKIRTSEHDLDRWICTIVRDDLRMGRAMWERLEKKYLPSV